MFQSTSLSQISTLQSEVITGGLYSDNTLSLTKQGGGSVDINFLEMELDIDSFNYEGEGNNTSSTTLYSLNKMELYMAYL